MALQATGPISFDDIRTEFGGTGAVSLGNYYAGGTNVDNDAFVIAGSYGNIPAAGAIDFQKFYGTRKGTNYTTYTASSSFTVPTNVIKVQAWAQSGGGGGGYGGTNFGNTAGGGGGGGYSLATFSTTPGSVITATVGSAGTRGTAYFSNGNAGGPSSFGAFVSSTGGGGGGGNTAAGTRGTGNLANGTAGTGGGGLSPGGSGGSATAYGNGGQGGGGGPGYSSTNGSAGFVKIRY